MVYPSFLRCIIPPHCWCAILRMTIFPKPWGHPRLYDLKCFGSFIGASVNSWQLHAGVIYVEWAVSASAELIKTLLLKGFYFKMKAFTWELDLNGKFMVSHWKQKIFLVFLDFLNINSKFYPKSGNICFTKTKRTTWSKTQTKQILKSHIKQLAFL